MAKFQPPTPEETRTLALWIKKGIMLESALLRCGIPKNVFKFWLRQGGQGIEPFKSFVETMDDALIKLETDLLSRIADHAEESVKTAQWLFILRFGKKYAAVAEAEAKRWAVENGHMEHVAPGKDIPTREDIESIERRALALEEPPEPRHKPTDLELAKSGKFGLQ